MLLKTLYGLLLAAGLAMLSGSVLAQERDQAAGAQPGAATASAADKEQRDRAYFTDLPLLTQDGRAVRFYSDVLKDHVVLINFIFTHCQDACPLLAKKLSEVQGLLSEQMAK